MIRCAHCHMPAIRTVNGERVCLFCPTDLRPDLDSEGNRRDPAAKQRAINRAARIETANRGIDSLTGVV